MSAPARNEHDPTAQGAVVDLPQSSLWPVTLAAGVALLLFGVVAGLIFGATGAVLIAVALAGWMGELRRE